jgi:ERF superfamily
VEQSENITELAKALTKLQGDLKTVPKEKINPFHKSKYADLSAIWEMCRRRLADNGLSLIQSTDVMENNIVLETTLLHTSGQWLRGKLALNPVKMDPQGIGSAMTYGRRYAMCAMLGIATDEDDDAESAMGRQAVKTSVSHAGPVVKKSETSGSSEAARVESIVNSYWLKKSLKELNWNPLEWIKEKFNISGDKVSEVLARMNEEQQEIFANEVKARLAESKERQVVS